MITRAPLLVALTPTEQLVVALLAEGRSYREIGKILSISPQTARVHARRAADKIPGDKALKPQAKCAAWWRGASLGVLTGEALYAQSGATKQSL